MRPLTYEQLTAAAREEKTQRVLTERQNAYAIVRLNDPASMNVLGAPMTVQLYDAVHSLAQDPAVRVIVLTGTGPAFSAGGDIQSMEQTVYGMIDEGPQGATALWRWIRYQLGGILRTIVNSDKPFVAAVDGACAGAGFAIAASCDLVISSDRARFVTAFGTLGLVPDVGTTSLLARRLGYQKAFELFVQNRPISGLEAKQLGLVNDVVPAPDLEAAVREWCGRLGKIPEHTLGLTKRMLRNASEMTWEQALVAEECAQPMMFTAKAHRDAVEAFLQKGASTKTKAS